MGGGGEAARKAAGRAARFPSSPSPGVGHGAQKQSPLATLNPAGGERQRVGGCQRAVREQIAAESEAAWRRERRRAGARHPRAFRHSHLTVPVVLAAMAVVMRRVVRAAGWGRGCGRVASMGLHALRAQPGLRPKPRAAPCRGFAARGEAPAAPHAPDELTLKTRCCPANQTSSVQHGGTARSGGRGGRRPQLLCCPRPRRARWRAASDGCGSSSALPSGGAPSATCTPATCQAHSLHARICRTVAAASSHRKSLPLRTFGAGRRRRRCTGSEAVLKCKSIWQ